MTIVSNFERVARQNPKSIASIHWQNGKWQKTSYADLMIKAQALANWLIGEGVSIGDPIVLPSQRSSGLFRQMLGILSAGAHYVFLDNSYPIHRKRFICSEVGAKLGIFDEGQEVSLDLPVQWKQIPRALQNSMAPKIPLDPELPAYIMFTSGSTGTPKGVVIPHRGVCRLVLDTDYMSFDEEQVFLQLSALSFDASTLEIWGPLLNGGTCVIYPDNGIPNPLQIRNVIEACGVTTLWLTSSLFNTIIAEHPECLGSLKQLLIGGEALSVAHVRKGLELLPHTLIYNGYGPTENTTFSTIYPIPRFLPDDIVSIPIGYPIKHTHCEIFDKHFKPVTDGKPGELIVFGDGLALGYLKKPELTAERFIEVICSDGVLRRGYRTGDLVVKQIDGSYTFLHRTDKQVKIDGHRIEPGEIELVINELDQVVEARVVVKTGPQGQKRLAAYIVGHGDVDRRDIRSKVSDVLPNYMVPHFIILLPELPKNQNGKLDEARLPDPFQDSTEIVGASQQIAKCWYQILGRHVDVNENFIDAGGTSLEALQLTELLEKHFNRGLGPTFVFEYPTIKAQARFFGINDAPQVGDSLRCSKPATQHDIAVIGMACRFPGANDLNEYWDNLINGRESISFFSDAELSDEISQVERSNPNYVRAKGIMADCDQFDAEFFGISPAEARIMDPQQRVMLQLAWHALEDAGYPPGEDRTRTGVFAGANWARYFQQYVLNNDDVKHNFGIFNASLANESDFLCPRISYKLNLSGPSINIFTACSTGLVAVAQACTSIERGECEMALAGGVSISTPVKSGYMYQEGDMLSRDGHCRPFDADATGTTFNDGAGFVVLKQLDLALRDGDSIYAVVKGWAVNNDGENKASFTAPSVMGQVEVYNAALAKADVAPETIGFIETHGTATPLGDPIEVRALAKSYASSLNRTASCALGSVKSNIGHTIHAAGIAGFIKAVKAVDTGMIPPTIHFNQPNPKLELEKTPFFVNNSVVKWRKDSPRRAAASALGVGGTNAHVIIEQRIEKELANDSSKSPLTPHPAQSILIAAENKQSLDLQILRYQKFFASQSSDNAVANEAYTAVVARRHFKHRAAVSGSTFSEIAAQLSSQKHIAAGCVTSSSESKLGFMFSGQGSQREQMGHWLYENNGRFRKIFDEGSEIVLAQQGFDPRSILFKGDLHRDTNLDVNQTKVAQPILFLFEYGLAQYLELCGCRPDFLIGHSVGEFTAAALAGIFTFEQAVKLVCARGALMQSRPEGKMLSVKATAAEVSELLNKSISLAAVNAPDRIVLSGPEESVRAASEALSKRNIANSVLHTSHAFHSKMMEPVIAEYQDLLGAMKLKPPKLPIFSTATGTLLTEQQATDAEYWAMQLRQTVRFADAVTAARDHYLGQNLAFVEVGPGTVLATLLGCQNAKQKNLVVAAAPSCGDDDKFVHELSQCLNRLWVSGYQIDWSAHFKDIKVSKTRLPGYAFLPNRHWLFPAMITGTTTSTETVIASPMKTDMREITMNAEEHLYAIEKQLRDLLEDVTGYDLKDVKADDHFSEAGLDSLLLTQAATVIEREFSVGITFRHLVEEYTTIGQLRDFIADKVAPETKEVPVMKDTPSVHQSVSQASPIISQLGGGIHPNESVQQLIAQQLQIMQMQLQALGGVNAGFQLPVASGPEEQSKITVGNGGDSPAVQENQVHDAAPKVRHTPGTRISREKIGVKLTKAQQKWLNEMMDQYQKKFAKSKQYTQKHRKYFSDPRTVSGFNPEWKEIIFPIVTEKSKGSKLWDIDGNELIDISNGFGPIFFGHSPDFITEAVKKQLDSGIETGPQSPLAGEVAKLFCDLTGNERCTFANTGSEAVIGAIRVARTVTGREKVVMFEGSYHGIFDEVINRPGRNFQALPAAPGIAREMTSNMLVLPWGEPESLDVLKKMSPDLAAVLVEPVQSRHPEFHDPDYLREIRKITQATGTAMILDEVVTGFRVHPGGIRKRFDIDADLATYGKVVGGGYPIGIIGGKARFMDALDGGYWKYGDDSIPECGVTFFAGTFVRHPLALAAAKAVLMRIRREGKPLYERLEKKTSAMAVEANTFIDQLKCEVKFEAFASFFYISIPANAHWGHMLFMLMVMEGINIQQFRPNFLTTAHSDDDIAAILAAFKKSLSQLVTNGLIEGDMLAARKFQTADPKIPPGAKLGKNEFGEAAYFIEDPNNKGNYMEVGKP